MKKTLRSVLFFTLGMYFPAMAAIYTVNTTTDGGPGSLRQAISDANANTGADDIVFNIPSSDPNYNPITGVCIITLEDYLPEITDAITINGLTQPGASAGNLMAGTPHTLKIEIRGTDTYENRWDGFYVTAGNVTIKGLAINRTDGFCARFEGGSDLVLQTNYFGLDASGLWADNTTNNGDAAYFVSCSNILVGGSTGTEGNVFAGIYNNAVTATNGTNLDAQGNIIGWDVTGSGGNEGFVCSYGFYLDNFNDILIGGNTTSQSNIISNCNYNIYLTGCDQVVIRGNTIGTNRTGTAILFLSSGNPYSDYGIYLENTISIPSAVGTSIENNLISGNESGIYAYNATKITISGNKIGTNLTGMSGLFPRGGEPDANAGIDMYHATYVAITNNLISGINNGTAINISGYNGSNSADACNFIDIKGNKIGTDMLGNPVIGNYEGIAIIQSYNVAVGGRAVGEGNIIANSYDPDYGYAVTWPQFVTSTVLVAGNSIFENRYGIQNDLMYFPSITSVAQAGGNTDIAGTLAGIANTQYAIDFYWSPTVYPSQYYRSLCAGQGKVYLGSTNVTTDGTGSATFTFTATGLIPDGWNVTTTSTLVSNNTTSEFSDPYIYNGANNVFIVTNTYDDESNGMCGSLRQAILDANAHPGLDYIHFNIPDTDPGYVTSGDYWSIQPSSGLPYITDAVVIDGYTQPGAQPNTTCMPDDTDAELKIEISGIQCSNMSRGLTLDNGGTTKPLLENCVIRGLVINHWFYSGIATFGVTNSSI